MWTRNIFYILNFRTVWYKYYYKLQGFFIFNCIHFIFSYSDITKTLLLLKKLRLPGFLCIYSWPLNNECRHWGANLSQSRKSVYNLASAPHTHSSASADSTSCRSVSTWWKKSKCLSGPAKFKPVLFKGQMYFLSKTYPLPAVTWDFRLLIYLLFCALHTRQKALRGQGPVGGLLFLYPRA